MPFPSFYKGNSGPCVWVGPLKMTSNHRRRVIFFFIGGQKNQNQIPCATSFLGTFWPNYNSGTHAVIGF